MALPPAQDLVIEPKPAVTEAVLTSAVAAEEYNSALEAYGDRGWAAVKRICQWAKAHGAKVECD